jgi:hypothetical protein
MSGKAAVVNMTLSKYLDEERKFVLNLTRLCGATNAVTVEYIIEAIIYINNHGIVEGQFIEENYLGSFFDDEEFLTRGDISVCSVQSLKDRYDLAKSTNDIEFLTLLRTKHRETRVFLIDQQLKERIRHLIEKRRKAVEHGAVWTAVISICGVIEHFPNSSFGQFMAPLLPQMLLSLPQIMDHPSCKEANGIGEDSN